MPRLTVLDLKRSATGAYGDALVNFSGDGKRLCMSENITKYQLALALQGQTCYATDLAIQQNLHGALALLPGPAIFVIGQQQAGGTQSPFKVSMDAYKLSKPIVLSYILL
jgi:hypothetical protein